MADLLYFMATACVDKSVFFANHYLTNIKAVFLFEIIKLPSEMPCFWTSRTVNSRHIPKSGHKPNNHAAFRRKTAGIYATGGSMKDQQSGKRRELLVLELEGRKMMGFLNGCSFAILHLKRPSVCVFGNGFDASNYIATVWPLSIFSELRAHLQA